MELPLGVRGFDIKISKFHFNFISKQIKIQEPTWSHLIDFSEMQIMEKNHLSAIKIERVMTL